MADIMTAVAAWYHSDAGDKLILIATAFLVAAIASVFLTPVAIRLARRAGAMDHPHARRVHVRPTPRWGGLAMLAAFIIALLVIFPLRMAWLGENMLNEKVLGILLGATLITLLGAIDDKYNVPAKVKLLGQILVALIIVLPPFNVRMVVIFDANVAPWLGGLLTILWVVVTTNVINLIDGLDGLAAGIAGFAAFTFVIIGMMKGTIGEVILAATILGCCVGFLRYNFHPARIFMGDAGSHFLGFTIGALSILQNWKVATSIAFAVPVLVLAVPLFDTTFAILRRLRRGQPIFSPDKGHLHHRLLNLGMDQRQVVLAIYALTAIACALALLVARIRLWE